MSFVNQMNRFVQLYNDTDAYPTLQDLITVTGLNAVRIKAMAAEARALNRAGRNEFDQLLAREGTEAKLPAPAGKGVTIELDVPPPVETVEQLIDRVAAANEREAELVARKQLVTVKLPVTGWFGVAGLPDQHLNNPGTRLRQAFEDARLIAATEDVYAVSIGDSLDNFIIGRLEASRRSDIISHGQAWEIQEHYFQILASSLILAIGGNHNDWIKKLGGIDILKRQFQDMGLDAVYDSYEQRIRIETAGGKSFDHLARHEFPGTSQFNPMHGLMKWGLQRWQGEHVMWGGHIHVSGYQQMEREWEGKSRVLHMVQLPSYKLLDEWAQKEKGFRSNTTFLVPVILHHAETGETIFHSDLRRGLQHLEFLKAAGV